MYLCTVKQTKQNDMAKLLLGKEYEVEGSWYSPKHYLREQRDVECVELWNTTSSSGDWTGFFVQKYKGRYWLVLFWQKCVPFSNYYKLKTDVSPCYSFDEKPMVTECLDVMDCLFKECRF